jgi:ATP-dependent Lon protease
MKLFTNNDTLKLQLELVPIIPTIDVVAFPGMIIPLLVVDQRIIKGIQEAFESDQKYVVLVACKKKSNKNNLSISAQDLHQVGTLASIIRIIPLQDGSVKVLVQGVSKVTILDIIVDITLLGKIKFIEYNVEDDNKQKIQLKVEAIKNIAQNMSQKSSLASDFYNLISKINSPEKIAELTLSHLTLSVDEAQQLLECITYEDFFTTIINFLVRENELIQIQEQIKQKAKQNIDNIQREFYVREQIKALKEELGEEENNNQEFKTKLNKLKIPEESHKEILKIINRLETMQQDSAESAILKTYLECALDLPWNIETIDNLNINNVKKILDEDHFGLTHVKNRILDFLSVRALSNNQSNNGMILCFYGPPGTGKTSLAQSIAKALNRKSFRISVGGMKDEAEIRGHRRTYVGAIPGRIIKGIRQIQSKNPIIIFDEIDKIGSDVRGDPASALLEVLDFKQNHNFYDYYLGLPFDLSKCIFITTANRIDTIPYALRDRLEFIELSTYTFEEKKEIAKKYFINQAIEDCGLLSYNVSLNDNIIEQIINDYTYEAGVRDLERCIKKLCSRLARFILEENKAPTVTTENLEDILGIRKFIKDDPYIVQKEKIGISRGLSWTACGGDTISIEAITMPGNGKLILTGQLGDVMKESAQAALSYIKSHCVLFKIDQSLFNNFDIHVHVPAGAIPKDGPSAGTAILTALLSVLTQKPLLPQCAMTGEIDLQGHVLPVGGIKEKVLAAKKNNIKRVILPSKNRSDINEIKNMIEDLDIIFVDHIDDVLEKVFCKEEVQVHIETIV